jgi:hypothetical protein
MNDELKQDLEANECCNFYKDFWLFEGDWALGLSYANGDIEYIGEIIVPSLGGMTNSEVNKIVSDQLELGGT